MMTVNLCQPALNAEDLANLIVSTTQLELPMVILTAYIAAVERLEPATVMSVLSGLY